MVYLYDACDQISDFYHQQLLRKMQRKISLTDGRTDRGKTVYPHPPSGSGGIISVTLVSESYVILYCEKNVTCNSSIKIRLKKTKKTLNKKLYFRFSFHFYLLVQYVPDSQNFSQEWIYIYWYR